MQTMIGVIGGSGVYQIDGLEGASWVKVKSPFGKPSDEVLVGRLDGVPMAFLPRHGRGHPLDPASVPYRANIDALKRLGCTEVVSVSAVGSLREDYAPGDFVIVEQYIDRTVSRAPSFFGPGCVAHVSLADPACTRLGAACATAARAAGQAVHTGATYIAIEGPQFSTRAESRLYRTWGADVIGMTGMPEARLAREAELCYACVAMVTDYDCWHDSHGAVDVAMVIRTLTANSDAARRLVARLPGLLGDSHAGCPQGCDHALDHAVMTSPDRRDPELVARLDAVAGRVL
ncbi:MAG: S-methyl-5'-thioadenosine phosphorylase [Tabrizicola sp.]|uniref:S-methyl-5'-thioadenosine phosphorylase n=1 Tax=Tabrizicola sp. TaxID=2005166 RepID=UPI002732A522|nr:S-methyl-5'-thioadenosine phosphorylase [Tabrizicola sp.]MDP3263832.1 S-methyl-5'-thioadenosine phosphorylase [Tabrizicola sp.]MDP3647196.1 S-methyl-5'-thioadenosine phosphorylase [Paracoccaceae bacterium]MDZ4067728.1 S-methyl-5'-thioadenosine phosphorylase [Tabrizicola sp.]